MNDILGFMDNDIQQIKMIDIIIGGLQEYQSVKRDGICTCLTSSMGCGGGYIPMIIEVQNG